jgi:hypothetical protein
MNGLASIARFSEPLPTIHRHYRSVAASPRGRLSARADVDGTLCLQFYPRSGAIGRRSSHARWRAGPLRTCHLVFEALSEGLSLLGERPSRERTLQLSRLIDRPLAQRLSQYLFLHEGTYERLTSHVLFTETLPEASLPPSIAWIAASVAGAARTREVMNSSHVVRTERETFLLVRQHKRWELWARMERQNSGSIPCRRYECLCSTDLLPEEPALAAELLLYATLARRPPVELEACLSGLIAPTRLKLIGERLAALGSRRVQPVNA